MQRSDFIRNLLGGIFFIGSGVVLKKTEIGNRKALLYTKSLNGTQYYDAALIFDQLQAGTPLIMKREPKNPFDTHAIAVYYRQYKLGYIPRRDNAIFSKILDLRPAAYHAEVSKAKMFMNDYVEIKIKIFEETKIKNSEFLP